jgi:O-antigen ligase
MLTNRVNRLNKFFWALFLFVLFIFLFFIFQDKLDVLQRLTSTFEDGDTANRDIIWSALWYFFSDHIFLGVGKTGYLSIIGDLSPHNAFLEIFIYTGLIGFVIFFIYLSRLFINVFVLYKKYNEIFSFLLCVAILGVILTGQIFDQKVVWFFLACLVQNRQTPISQNG